MNPQLIQLFRDALDLPIDERSAYLDAQCADPDLRAQIEALLLTAEATQPPLANLVLPTDAFAGPSARLVDRSGELIGAFRILKILDVCAFVPLKICALPPIRASFAHLRPIQALA